MIAYDWYKIFNKAEFEALDLVSKTYTVSLEDVGQKDILVTKGISIGVLYDETYLVLNLNDQNPFEFEDLAIYLNEDDDVFLGIKIED